ncbi:carotenoid biosynthesis protein [Rhodococcus sp. G-MC3]|uniref:carotenoid biosynthesis protein n=1 Tax=Rhodococcus sp. G-MC3 TaxID=3046209 RepID=UPI0024BBAA6A|nr:carotenoid biosynthesis protein [Rhodococcus sp. G-MC3]MDJ0393076.1 carotenoid biosynthesis protein [Rhodococcus sp. G-MC3]
MNRVVWALVSCAIGAQIVYPLVTGSVRDSVTVAVVVLLAAAAMTHAAASRGPRWALTLFLGTAGLGLVAEMVGTATGFPFGSYYYAVNRLGPDIFGVPAVVPLAWTAGFYPIWCAVTFVLESTAIPRYRASAHRIVVTAVGMVGWDFYLDNQMVTDAQWTWTSSVPGLPGVPSIPVSNYLGWFLVALVMALIVEGTSRRVRPNDSARADAAPLVMFMWTWLGSAVAHAVLLDGQELRFSAVYGFAAMGVVGVPLARALVARSGRTYATPRRLRTTP